MKIYEFKTVLRSYYYCSKLVTSLTEMEMIVMIKKATLRGSEEESIPVSKHNLLALRLSKEARARKKNGDRVKF